MFEMEVLGILFLERVREKENNLWRPFRFNYMLQCELCSTQTSLTDHQRDRLIAKARRSKWRPIKHNLGKFLFLFLIILYFKIKKKNGDKCQIQQDAQKRGIHGDYPWLRGTYE